jgi:NADH-quinone oxidoreductase subunit M
MSNAGLPGTSGFVGEFMVILAAFRADFWFAFLAATTLVLAAAFTLWMVKRVIYGEVKNEKVAALADLNRREVFNLGALAAVVLLFGLWPAPLVDVMHKSVEHLVAQVSVCKLPAAESADCLLARPEPVAFLAP